MRDHDNLTPDERAQLDAQWREVGFEPLTVYIRPDLIQEVKASRLVGDSMSMIVADALRAELALRRTKQRGE